MVSIGECAALCECIWLMGLCVPALPQAIGAHMVQTIIDCGWDYPLAHITLKSMRQGNNALHRNELQSVAEAVCRQQAIGERAGCVGLYLGDLRATTDRSHPLLVLARDIALHQFIEPRVVLLESLGRIRSRLCEANGNTHSSSNSSISAQAAASDGIHQHEPYLAPKALARI
jgi:hypothetical protein